MVNIDYCYLNDAVGIENFRAEDYAIYDEDLVCDVRATIRGKCYKDPDIVSQKLYKDEVEVWGRGQYFFKEEQGIYRIVDCDGNRYSSDYIGPSRYWAHKAGISNEEIGAFLKVCRTIGGHIFWPVHRGNTINFARGGKSGVYDRIDLTLFELKNYYAEKEAAFSNKLFNAFGQTAERDWLKGTLKEFDSFLERFDMQDFLLNGKIISLAHSDLKNKQVKFVTEKERKRPRDYSLYIKNMVHMIQARNDRIDKRLRVSEAAP